MTGALLNALGINDSDITEMARPASAVQTVD